MNHVLPFPSQGESGSREFDLSELIHDVCDCLETKRVASRVTIEIDAPPHTIIRAHREHLRQAIERLLTASFAASPIGSDVVLTTFSDDLGVELEIAGGGSFLVDGQASPDSHANRLTGGDNWQDVWSEIRRVVTKDGADISMDSCPDGGLAFTLHFPRNSGDSVRARWAA